MLDKLLPLPMKKLAVAALPKLALPDDKLPVTARLVKVPTLVMFGCAAVVTVPAVPAVAAFKLATCVVEATVSGAVPVATFEVSVLATTAPAVFRLPALALPVTAREVNVPTDVMFG